MIMTIYETTGVPEPITQPPLP